MRALTADEIQDIKKELRIFDFLIKRIGKNKFEIENHGTIVHTGTAIQCHKFFVEIFG